MSTRPRTRAAAATAAAAAAATPSSATTTTTHTPPAATPSKSTKGKRKSNPPTPIKQEVHASDPSEKENIKTATVSPTATSISTKAAPNSAATKKQPRSKTKTPAKSLDHCTCSRGDDGSPMIQCAECERWYHFICVDLTENEAEEINVYICSPCTKSTGRKTAMVWEGIDALEDCGSEVGPHIPKVASTATPTPTTTTTSTQRRQRPNVIISVPPPRSRQRPTPQSPQSSSDTDGSEDDYIDEKDGGNSKTKGKRLLRHISSSSSSESETGITTTKNQRRRKPTKLRKISSRSPTPTSPSTATVPTPSTTKPAASASRLKRKSSITEASGQPVKRKRSDTVGSGGATDDPVRKYCLGKLEELFREVFLRYSYVRVGPSEVPGEGSEGVGDGDVKKDQSQGQEGQQQQEEGRDDKGQAQIQGTIVPKKQEEMTEEEKESLMGDSKRFAGELEQCVFDIYSEPDKIGQPHAGTKYKDRFRMLQFNLSKPDRTVIHQRIITRTITPKEISLMSSTDLADEETKQHIKIAEKESLEQTILQKSVIPRAKITHKGLQDIEDVNGNLTRAREIERQREREQEEEERRERERKERLRAQQRQRTQSMSLPPESPTVPSHSPIIVGDHNVQTSWGAPPPVPAHVLQHQHQHQQSGPGGDDILNPSIRPVFVPTMSDVVMASAPEPELNLADLINIDEDGAEQDGGNGQTAGAGPGFDGVNISSPEDVATTTTGMDSNSTAVNATADSSLSGAPAPLSEDQSIQSDGSVSDKLSGTTTTNMINTVSGFPGHLAASATAASLASPTTPSIVSPFSANRSRGFSFDLNSLWQSTPKDDKQRTSKSPPAHDQPSPSAVLDADKGGTASGKGEDAEAGNVGGGDGKTVMHGIVGGVRDLVMEPERMEVANDDDFDMFLEEKDDVVDRSSSNGVVAAGIGDAAPNAPLSGPDTAETRPPQVVEDPEAAFEAIPLCWKGEIHMPLESTNEEAIVSAKQIGGRTLGHQSLWWKALFNSDVLKIEGRVPTRASEEFLTQMRLSPYKELIAAAFSPVTEDVRAGFDALIERLKSRDRHGLSFPWGQRRNDTAPVRELYLVPLQKNEPLPEYLELLDQLKVPKNRNANLIIGIWILNKGKLDEPPPQAPSSTSMAAPPPAASTALPSTNPNIPPLPPHFAALASQSLPVQTPQQTNPAPAPPPGVLPLSLPGPLANVDTAALAAEVANLRPDQVQDILRSLSHSGVPGIPFPFNLPTQGGGGGAPQPLLMSGQPSHHGSHPPPPPLPPAWPGYPIPPGPPPLPQPPGSYPPPGSIYGAPPPPPHPHSFSPLPPPPAGPPHHGPPDHDRRDSYGPSHGHRGSGRGGDRDRGGERGWRGGSGGGGRHNRSRGKHRGGNTSHRPVDSGWPKRPRNEDGNGSPGRRW